MHIHIYTWIRYAIGWCLFLSLSLSISIYICTHLQHHWTDICTKNIDLWPPGSHKWLTFWEETSWSFHGDIFSRSWRKTRGQQKTIRSWRGIHFTRLNTVAELWPSVFLFRYQWRRSRMVLGIWLRNFQQVETWSVPENPHKRLRQHHHIWVARKPFVSWL